MDRQLHEEDVTYGTLVVTHPKNDIDLCFIIFFVIQLRGFMTMIEASHSYVSVVVCWFAAIAVIPPTTETAQYAVYGRLSIANW